MAKTRCPQCGATHKEPPRQCRLCGYIMDGTVATPMGTTGSTSTVTTVTKKKGTASIALIGLAIVVVIALAAVLLGFTTGDLTVGNLRDKVPFLRQHNDGWVKVEDTEGGFTVDLPSSRQTGSKPFTPAENGRLTGWTATIGTDTSMAVMYGKITPANGESTKGTLNRLVDYDIVTTINNNPVVTRKASEFKRTDTDYRGYPAVVYEIHGLDLDGRYADEKAVMFLKGDEVYQLSMVSVYEDFPQWSRLVDSFQFTA